VADDTRGPAFEASKDPAVVPGPAELSSNQVVCGAVLCLLRVWREDEWAALSESERPARRIHVPGLGWVGAVPTVCLN